MNESSDLTTEKARIALTDEERLALSAVVHQNYYMPDVFKTVEQIIEARLSGPGMAVRYQSPNGTSLTRCCCDQTTARLVVCPTHPDALASSPGKDGS